MTQDNQTTFSSSYPFLKDVYGGFGCLVISSVSSVQEGEFLLSWWFHMLLPQISGVEINLSPSKQV